MNKINVKFYKKNINTFYQFLNSRNTKSNKRQEITSFRTFILTSNTQKMRNIQNINMSWYYPMFPRHPVPAERFKTRVRNKIVLYYHYRVDPNLGKFIFFEPSFSHPIHKKVQHTKHQHVLVLSDVS